MASGSEVVLPIGTQKHDPAWKHCLMVRSGGRTMLKCMYCMKLFLGGGIHRIKEHLAKQKGNASRCPKVPIEVQDAMQLSLDTSASRKHKKIKPNPLDPSPDSNSLFLMTAQHVDPTSSIPLELPPDPPKLGRGRRKHPRNATPASVAAVGPHQVADNKNNVVSIPPLPSFDKEQVQLMIGRFLYEAGVPLEAVNSPYFRLMIDAIQAVGPGFEVPSYHDIRGRILKKSVEEVHASVEDLRVFWSKTGCSVLADEWITDTGKTLINFLVYCPEGMVFLRSVDATHMVSSVDTLFELMRDVVENVGVSNVVQVITNMTDEYILAGRRLMEVFPTLFWTPCASRCIEGMLEDIGKMEAINDVIENAKSITAFIYNHATILNLMRKYTSGRDLLASGESLSAANFTTLKRMGSLKENLRALVVSDEWMVSPYTKKPAGLASANLITSLAFWSSCCAVVRITEPLLRLHKMVDGNKRPSVGYIYMGLYQAREAIRKVLVKKSDYLLYWNIMDCWWSKRLSRPLHAAAFFLNPKLFYSIQGEVSNEISSAVLDCIERLVPEGKLQDKIQKELNLYKSAAGDFGRKMAGRARHTLLPAEWWSTYGGACPNLMRLAIHILSQCGSAKGCERNNIPFELIHNQGINCLEHQRICDLVYVRYNLRLQPRQHLRNKLSDPISIENHYSADGWILDKADVVSGQLEEDSNWMILNQPLGQGMQTEYVNEEEFEAFISGLDDDAIQGAAQGIEDDDCRGEDDNHDRPFACD